MTAPSNKWDMMWSQPIPQQILSFHPEFACSGHLILTDNYNISIWWLAICKCMQKHNFWWSILDEKARIITVILFKTVEIWFAKQPRKPPDKPKPNSHSIGWANHVYDLIMEYFSIYLFLLEDNFTGNRSTLQAMTILSSKVI